MKARPAAEQVPSARLLAAVDQAVRWVAYLGGAVLGALMLLTVVDVTLRAFGRPIFGAQDYTQLFLLVVVALSIAFSGRAGGHVAVDLLSLFVKRDAGYLQRALDSLLSRIPPDAIHKVE